ncbi:hypothetical protein E2C01_000521 [Portunus trituberculatus]|uniref:Uncharacterized protein n=1 Tax=Portunus trituberculatus TaxID=210409 RepID=A0A5B7CEB2_PORTR|nr:hypothetical protein [Portunus trituberculatus]
MAYGGGQGGRQGGLSVERGSSGQPSIIVTQDQGRGMGGLYHPKPRPGGSGCDKAVNHAEEITT